MEYIISQPPKVNLKGFITSLITGASLFTASNISPVIAAGCEDAPPTGDKIYPIGPGQYKIRSTVRRILKSNNERKIEFAFKKLELEAMRKLALFLEAKVVNFDNLTDSQKDEVMVVGDGDTEEEVFKAGAEIISGINLSADQLIQGSVEIGRCHEPGVAVMITRGINSETAELLSGSKSNNIKNSDSNSNSNSNTQTNTYRSDVDQGYSGYGNLDDF